MLETQVLVLEQVLEGVTTCVRDSGVTAGVRVSVSACVSAGVIVGYV